MEAPEFEILVFQSSVLATACKIFGVNMARNRFLYWVKLYLGNIDLHTDSSTYQIHASNGAAIVMIIGPLDQEMRTSIENGLDDLSALSESDYDD